MPRGMTPIGSAIPSLEASNQLQIDDLVQRTRTLEHAKQKLAEQLTHETARSKEAIAELQKQWKQEKLEWNQTADVLHSCHRVVQLRNLVSLERERANVLKEQDITRKEKLLRLQRDFRITMFQAREGELEYNIGRLEAEREALIVELEQSTRHSKGQHAEYHSQLKAKDSRLGILQEESKELEVKLDELQEDVARFKTNKEEMSKQLERAKLQAESAITARDDLKRTNEDLKRANAEMHSQLEKWQNLENKGGLEIELQRKKHEGLQTQIRELQSELEEAKEERGRFSEKEKKKLERFKENIKEWQAECEKHEKATEDAQKQLAKAMKQISKLKEALEAERKKKPVSLPPDNDVEHAVPQPESPVTRPRPRPRQANNKPSIRADSVELNDIEATGKSGAAKGSASPPKSKRASPVQYHGESEVEEVPPRAQSKSKNKGKAKATAETEELDFEVQHKPGRRKRKAEEVEIDDEDQDEDDSVVPASQKAKKAKRSRDEVPARARNRAPSRARSASVRPQAKSTEQKENSDAEGEPAAKKKRRKINIFPTNVPASAFDFTSNVGDGGLNIPTALSPVKESENVRARSTSGSVIDTIGSMLRNSFAPRR